MARLLGACGAPTEPLRVFRRGPEHAVSRGMLYWGLGFLVLAVTTLVLGSLGLVPGAGGFTNVTLIMALILLGAGALTLGHQHYHRRRRMRLHHAPRV